MCYAVDRDGDPVAAFDWSPSARTGRPEAPGAAVAVSATGQPGRWVFALAGGRPVARAEGVSGSGGRSRRSRSRPGQRTGTTSGAPMRAESAVSSSGIRWLSRSASTRLR